MGFLVRARMGLPHCLGISLVITGCGDNQSAPPDASVAQVDAEVQMDAFLNYCEEPVVISPEAAATIDTCTSTFTVPACNGENAKAVIVAFDGAPKAPYTEWSVVMSGPGVLSPLNVACTEVELDGCGGGAQGFQIIGTEYFVVEATSGCGKISLSLRGNNPPG